MCKLVINANKEEYETPGSELVSFSYFCHNLSIIGRILPNLVYIYGNGTLIKLYFACVCLCSRYSAPRSGRSWMSNNVRTPSSRFNESSYDSFFFSERV